MAEPEPADLRHLVDEQCDTFEAAWQRGQRPDISDFLAGVPDHARSDLLAELLALDMELRARAGQWPDQSIYKTKYPDDHVIIGQVFNEFQSWAQATDAVENELKSRIVLGEQDTQSQALETKEWSPDDPQPEPSHKAALGSEATRLPRQIGRYEVLRKLGQGGMGTVLLAHDTVLDRNVALKLPHFNVREDAAGIERFYREARAMATIHHANLCPIHDVGEHEGQPYITMAYIDGQSLAEAIATEGTMDPYRAIQLIRKLALAMQAVHEAGVLHRDLKPSNVMIDQQGEPFITDFGLASRDRQMEADLTQSGTVIGSPAYMAPEQVSGTREAIGSHTDVYALGVILYQLLCGRRPYDGSGLAVLGQISSGKPPTPPSELADVDEQLEAICLKAMAHEVDDRFPTADKLADALRSLPNESSRVVSPVATTAGFPKEATDPRKRHRWLVWGIAACTLSLIVGTAAMVFVRPNKPTGLERASSANNEAHRIGIASRPSGDAIDLIAMIDPVRDSYTEHARFRIDSGVLFTPPVIPNRSSLPMAERNTRLVIPVSDMPNEYDLTIVVERKTTEPSSLNVGVIRDGHQATVAIDGFDDHRWVLETLYSPEISGDILSASHHPLELGTKNEIVFQVRADAITVLQNGSQILRFTGDSSQLQAIRHWRVPDREGLIFGCQGEFAVYELKLLPMLPSNNVDDAVNNPWGFTVQDSGQRLGTAESGAVEFGDFDGDGDLDAVVANAGSEPNRILLNDGHGRFSEGTHHLGTDSLRGLAVGDVDNDGDLDIFLACDGGPNTVWLNDGKAKFSVSEQQFESSRSAQVALADFDGDGDLDAWIGKLNPHDDAVWINDGKGRFTDSGQLLGKERVWGVNAGDVDGDGDIDVLVATGGKARNSLWLNDGKAQFTRSDQVFSETDASNWFEIGDLNGDGANDLFQTCYAGTDRVWLNDGTGQFTETGQQLPNINSKRARFADLDEDGDLDVVVTGLNNDPNYVMLNDGSGHFVERVQWFGHSTSNGLALGDLDGDGDLDAFVANGSDQPNRIWINTAVDEPAVSLGFLPSEHVTPKETTAQFVDSGQEFDPDDSTAVAAGDLDGDGNVDVIVTRNDASNQVWLNDGLGYFSIHQEFSLAAFGKVALGDLDSDGDLDAVFVRANSNVPGGIWMNDGHGTFTDTGQSLAGHMLWDIELADLDNDSDLDVVVADRKGPNLVFRNDSSGLFVNTEQTLGESESTGVQIGDLDGDGDNDLFFCNYSLQPNTVWFNDGNGVFADSGQRLGSSKTHAIAITDLDQDGDLDVYAANVDGTDSIWINDGMGEFKEKKPFERKQTSSAVAVGDLNGDARDDLFIANGFRRTAEAGEILLSTGIELAFDVRLSLEVNATDIALADFDGDGDLDAFVTTIYNAPNRVWFNQTVDKSIASPGPL